MSILHIVRKSAFSSTDLMQCLALISISDTLVFIDDGCYNVNHPALKKSLLDMPQLRVNVMQSHAQARAIKIIEPMTTIEMKNLIALTFTHENVITWQ